MNVHDFEPPPLPDTWREILVQIFERQKELMDVYQQIEHLPKPPVSLHTPQGQRVIRDFAWRATEELAESYEAMEAGHQEHQYEELADAMHFLVEGLIFAGITAEQCLEYIPIFPDNEIPFAECSRSYWAATCQLGIAMNFLRNKAWKQSHVPTDERRFRDAMIVAFVKQVLIWADLGLGASSLHGFYFRKSDVNKFRQRSNY